MQCKLDFRNGSEADVKASVGSVCFAPKSRLETASWHVSVGPRADIEIPGRGYKVCGIVQGRIYCCLFFDADGELGRTLPHGSTDDFLSGIFWMAAL